MMHTRVQKADIPIELLRTFEAVADLASFTKAAGALGISQPAVSGQIKRLEEILGSEIFSRHGSRSRLTAYGELVIGYARRILVMNDQLIALAGSEPNQREFRIGIPSWLEEGVLSRLFEEVSSSKFGMNIHYRSDKSDRLARGLQRGFLILFSSSTSRRPRFRSLSGKKSSIGSGRRILC
jgi:DNA-binding transcriptional LysR family regulator